MFFNFFYLNFQNFCCNEKKIGPLEFVVTRTYCNLILKSTVLHNIPILKLYRKQLFNPIYKKLKI